MPNPNDAADPDAEDPHEPPQPLVEAVAERLRGPCAHLPPEAFAALVLGIARSKHRAARRAAGIPGLSGFWDPPDLPEDVSSDRLPDTERRA